MTNALRVTFAPLCGSGSHGTSTLADEEIRARASAASAIYSSWLGANRVGERNCIGSQRVTSGNVMVSQWLRTAQRQLQVRQC